ncbi:MAG TPA: CBS domain-containing protein [Myxococcota bacterium]|nr:CBS domain-containing protein [Myxococcota bacterium]
MLPTARELMEARVLTVDPEASLEEVYHLFSDEEISGAPVVGDDGRLVGVITATDLIRAADQERDTARVESGYFRDLLPYSAPDWSFGPEDFQSRLAALRASDVMTREVVAVPPDMPANAVARLLRSRRIHRVFVTTDGQLLGVVSAFDLLRVLEDLKE